MRQLKHHEQKLLKKVDFLQWKQDAGLREVKVMRRYHIQNRDDYASYNRLVGSIRSYTTKLAQLNERDPFRQKMEAALVAKLYDMALLDATGTVTQIDDKVTVSAFCRRRLAVVMCKLKMCQSVKTATQFIEQGHVRVGPDTTTDPAFLVTRNMEDFVTWVDTSKLKRTIAQYNDELDDFNLMA